MNRRIIRIEWARMEGERPRSAGCNARLGPHGKTVRPSIARVTTNDGYCGFGWSAITPEMACKLLGASLSEIFSQGAMLAEAYRPLEYPLLDLWAKLEAKPVYALLRANSPSAAPLLVPCYDTSLYIDDLHLQDDAAAAALIASEALDGLERGHRHFKIKIGRGAMHMPLEEGTRRDIAVIRAVCQAVGSEAHIMVDANNGLNVNLAKRILSETAEARLYWLEEAFHEDARLYAHLQEWLDAQGIETRIADGEGDASPRLLEWAREGFVDIVQYDILRPGFSFWLSLGSQLDRWGVRSAPHHYGEPFGNYAACHLAVAIEGFEAVEWDEATVPGLDASAYTIADGWVQVPDRPGFGLELDSRVFERAVAEDGFTVAED